VLQIHFHDAEEYAAVIVEGRAYVFLCFHFNFMQKYRFQYQFEGKGLEINFGPSVKLSDKKNQNGRQNPIWLPISSLLSQYPSLRLYY